MSARPETKNVTLPDVLRTLLTIEDGAALTALLPTIRFHKFDPPLTAEDRATLLAAVAAATARCWTRRWPADCCD